MSGEHTTRSRLEADHLVQQLQTLASEQLQDEDEVWVVLDGSDLRKPHARKMAHLQRVKRLEGTGLVNGDRTLNALGLGKTHRGLLYHRLFSSHDEAFVSEPREVQRALTSVGRALSRLSRQPTVVYLLDSGFDDVAVWHTIWQPGHHLVGRVYHLERQVERSVEAEPGERLSLAQAAAQGLVKLATVQTELEVRLFGQRQAKRQKVTVQLAASPVQLRYQVDEGRGGDGVERVQPGWLVKVQVLNSPTPPWWLLTDQAVTTAEQAQRVFQQYRQRWAIEDTFRYTKECLGWEEVQVLHFQAVRRLVALAWVVAGFLFELGVHFEEPEVRLLARLGGWQARAHRRPGRIVLTRGLRRLLDHWATEAIVQATESERGCLPPRLARLLGPAPG